MATGVYLSHQKNGQKSYRVSVTYHNKHISLGSFFNPADAENVYHEAKEILSESSNILTDIDLVIARFIQCHSNISLEKFIILLNFRDFGMYIKTPVYLCKKHFFYFLSAEKIFTFDVDDLFFYSTHKILSRGGHYYVNDYGMQISILSRYGIRPHAVCGRDYYFKNEDTFDLRDTNLCVINRMYGVVRIEKNGRFIYKAKIHINGDFVIGTYPTEAEAAISYNKAIDLIAGRAGIIYQKNYLENLSSIEYASIYNRIRLSKNLRNYISHLQDS